MQTQTSETFRLSALLSFSGGLQDAYTYNVRGRVFANAQTGNVVLMSQNFMMGEWGTGLLYTFPLLAFALGVFAAERIENRFKRSRSISWQQIVLVIEILMLGVVGFLPAEFNMLANMLVSFSCAMQVQTFRKVRGFGYASTMCIGNLRSGTESLSIYLREKIKTHCIRQCIFTYLCCRRGNRRCPVRFPGDPDDLGLRPSADSSLPAPEPGEDMSS